MKNNAGNLLLVVFLLLNILNIFPGPYQWTALVFGFFPIQFLFWILVHFVAALILGVMLSKSSLTPWLKD